MESRTRTAWKMMCQRTLSRSLACTPVPHQDLNLSSRWCLTTLQIMSQRLPVTNCSTPCTPSVLNARQLLDQMESRTRTSWNKHPRAHCHIFLSYKAFVEDLRFQTRLPYE